MRPAREIALVCAPHCWCNESPCTDCGGTGKLGVEAITTAIELRDAEHEEDLDVWMKSYDLVVAKRNAAEDLLRTCRDPNTSNVARKSLIDDYFFMRHVRQSGGDIP